MGDPYYEPTNVVHDSSWPSSTNVLIMVCHLKVYINMVATPWYTGTNNTTQHTGGGDTHTCTHARTHARTHTHTHTHSMTHFWYNDLSSCSAQ